MKRYTITLGALLLASLLLVGCGQKGPLYRNAPVPDAGECVGHPSGDWRGVGIRRGRVRREPDSRER